MQPMKQTGKERWEQQEAEMKKLAEARKLWEESESVLRCLRTRSAKPTNQPDDTKLIEWHAGFTTR